MFFLRPATDKDISIIASVIAASFEEHRGKLNPPSSSLDKTPLAVRQELQTTNAIVALHNNKIIGCVFYSVKEDYVYLAHLAVLPSHRRMGIAKTLIAAVEMETSALGLFKIRLSVRLTLEDTQALYKHLGYTFHSYGTHSGYETPTYINLQKHLNPKP